MPYKDPEKRKQYQRQYHRRKRQTDPEYQRRAREYGRRWNKANPDKRRALHRRSYHKLRRGVLIGYGGDPPKCACCGEKYIEFLELDHIDGGGKKHRKQFSSNTEFYRWLKKSGYPSELGLRILCSNCNDAYARWGYCPHQKGKGIG